MAHSSASSGPGSAAPAFVREGQAWRHEVRVFIGIAVLVAALMLPVVLHHSSERVPVAVQVGIAAALLGLVGGILAVKGRRAGFEIGPDGITVCRCWLPNQHFGWDEIQGYSRLDKCYPRRGSGGTWVTYVVLVLNSGRPVKTLGVATTHSTAHINTPPRLEQALKKAEEKLAGQGIEYAVVGYSPLRP